MPQYLIYIIPVAIVLIVFIAGFAYSRRMVAKNQIPAAPTQDRPANSGIYEAHGASQQSDHVLGAVQSVIRGRGRFLPFGLMFIGVSGLGLWELHFTGILTEYTETPLTKLAATVILVGGIVWGLRMISYITYRVKLRRTGFEISSVFGTKAYEYKDADFYLGQTIEHKHNSEGYRPVVMKAGNYNYIWQCQIVFRDGRKPIILKSSRYAWLKTKIQSVIDGLYGCAGNATH